MVKIGNVGKGQVMALWLIAAIVVVLGFALLLYLTY
jgi:hypothetical protein